MGRAVKTLRLGMVRGWGGGNGRAESFHCVKEIFGGKLVWTV